MKYYTLDELNKNLGNYIASLGVSQQFLDQPAYEAVVNRVSSIIFRPGHKEDTNVSIGEGHIKFECCLYNGHKQTFDLSAGPKSIICTSWHENNSYNGNGQEKIGEQIIAKIDDNEWVTICENSVTVRPNEEDYQKSEVLTVARHSTYTNDGIMQKFEEKGFYTRPLGLAFNEVGRTYDGISAPFFVANNAFDFNTIANNYDSKVILVRDKFDTAKAYAEYKNSGEEYRATVQLNSEHGLRDMKLSSSPQDWIFPITPATQDYLDATIGQEKNPKVAAALAKLAVGRDTYYYNPEMDEDYIHENSKNGQGKSR